jgi:selenide,water dikinase
MHADGGMHAGARRLLRGRPLQRFSPQRTYLSLISTGDRYAVATKGPFCLEVPPGSPCGS